MVFNSGLFAGFKDANVFASGPPKIPAGFDGDVKVLKTILFQTRTAGLAFIAEMEVVTSNHPSHPVGSKVSYFQSTSRADVAFNNMLEFLVAALGMDRNDPDQVGQVKTHAEKIFGDAVNSPEQNEIVGRTLHVRGEGIVTKNGQPFIRKSWTVADGTAGPMVQYQAPPAQPVQPAPTAQPGAMPPAPWNAGQPVPTAQPTADGNPPPWSPR